VAHRDPLDFRVQETTESVIGQTLFELSSGTLTRELRVESADEFDVLL
jgi:hypothetical protein